MYCTRCGTHNDEDQRFCTRCGSPLDDGEANAQDAWNDLEKTRVDNRGADFVYMDGAGVQRNVRTRHTMWASRGPIIAVSIVACMAIAIIAIVVADPWGVIWRGSDSDSTSADPYGSKIVGSVVVNPPSPNSTGGGSSTTGSVKGSSSSAAGAGTLSAEVGVDRYGRGKSSVAANLTNGGHFAAGEDGMLYYAAPVNGTDWNTTSIVRCSMDGSGKKTIYSAPAGVMNLYHLNVIGDRIVFNQVIEKNSSVVCMHTDGSSVRTLDSCDDWSLCQVADGWVYYLKSGRVCRCDMDGGNKAALASVGAQAYWRIAGDALITFSEKGARDILVSKLDGTERRIAYSASNGYEIRNAFPISATALQVWEVPMSGDGARLSKLDLETSSNKVFWTSQQKIERMCAYDNGAIITQAAPDGTYTVATIPYDKGNIDAQAVVARGVQARYTAYVQGSILYGIMDAEHNQACSIRSMSFSGLSSGVYNTIA